MNNKEIAHVLKLNRVLSIIIIVLAIMDFAMFFLGMHTELTQMLMIVTAVALIIITFFIGRKIKKLGIVFEENIISQKLGIGSEYLNDYSTLVAAIFLLASIFFIGYVNILTIGAAAYTVMSVTAYLKS